MKEDVLKEIIKEGGFRATKPRVALVSLLHKAKEPMRVQEIARKLGKSVDPVTVYRMVEAFKEAGIVREVNLRGENPRYELQDEHDHHHLVCTDCGRIEDFTDEGHGRAEKRVLARSKDFAKVTGHSFDLYGLCKTCVK